MCLDCPQSGPSSVQFLPGVNSAKTSFRHGHGDFQARPVHAPPRAAATSMTGETVAVLDGNRNHAEFIVRSIARAGRRVVWARTVHDALESGAALVVARQSSIGSADAMLRFIAGALMHGQHTIAVTSDRTTGAAADALSLAAVATVRGWWNGEALARAVDEFFAREAAGRDRPQAS